MAQSFATARFLTVQEVADLMRVSTMTVYRIIKSGELPAVRVGRSFRCATSTSTRISASATRKPADVRASTPPLGPGAGGPHRSRASEARTLTFVPIAFASDYGLADEFVGVCKAVMLGLAPDVRDPRPRPRHPRARRARRQRSSWSGRSSTCPTTRIVVAVVDPGVGTDRRLVGVEVEGGVLLGPDNGLLAPAVAMAGGPRRVVALENPDYQLPAPGPTFAGRDVLAPAAGHLAAGVPLDALGPEVDPAGLVPGLVSLPEIDESGAIAGEVWWVDRFGNCQLNIDPDELVASYGSASR